MPLIDVFMYSLSSCFVSIQKNDDTSVILFASKKIICQNYEGDEGKARLKKMIKDVPKINHWEDVESVLPHYQSILNAIMAVSADLHDKQTPFKPFAFRLCRAYTSENLKAGN